MNDNPPLAIALLLATPGTTWGGMEKHTAELALTLADQGHQVDVIAHRAYRHRFNPRAHFHDLPVQLGRRNPWLRFRLARLLRSLAPDVVHAQGSKAAQLLAGESHKRGRPVLLGTVHGTKSSHRPYAALDGVIAVSREILEAIDHPNTCMIHNGIDPPAASPEGDATAIPAAAGQPLIVAAGRLEPVKQYDRLIRAWALADRQGQLAILGEGSERARLQALVTELGMEGRITLPGFEADIQPWLRGASACVISSAREGFPYILVEALLAGCPVLTTPVSGVREFLPASAIAASDRVEDLAKLLGGALDNPGELKQQQRDSMDRAQTSLTLSAMTGKTLAFYRQLLVRSSSGQR